jgi:hypothetical protein
VNTVYVQDDPEGCTHCGTVAITEPRVVRVYTLGVGAQDYSVPHCARCGEPRGDLARAVQ